METVEVTTEQTDLITRLEAFITEAKGVIEQQKAASQSFAMTAAYMPRHNAPAITAGPENVILVNPGEIATFVALPGAGKTQGCEALACAYLSDLHRLTDIDTLGMKAYSTAHKRCLYIDTERPHDDNYHSYQRILRRIGADKNTSLITEDRTIAGLDYRCTVDIPDVQMLKNEVERLCTENDYGLIIVDGALDFVASMNNEEECANMVKWLRALAHRQDTAIAVTLHPNKGTETMAGHLGAMLYRYSRACLCIRPHEGNSDIKVITNQFANGKLSHGGFDLTIPFKWDDESRMMMSLPDEAAPVSARVKVSRETIHQLFNSYAMNGRFWIPSTEVKADYAERFDKSEKTARDHVTLAIQNGWIETRGSGPKTEYKFKENEEL